MASAIDGLQPAGVWKYFAEIAAIPRGSKNETAITKYVAGKAKELGLGVKVDGFGNVVVSKPASPGHERVGSICLQGHLDMVCEKNKETVHDFTKDPIELVRRGNVLMANGTTLGADNGIAVATNLAIMEDKSLEHGPLEFLFTVDEETGLTGANNLAEGFVTSKTLMNLDSEEEGALYVGCSGGKGTVGTWTIKSDPLPPKSVVAGLKVQGLRGGHSGLEIHKGRGNSVKILNRVLMALEGLGCRVMSLEGGDKHNAIPREAEAVVALPAKNWEKAVKMVQECTLVLKAEVSTVDPDLAVTLSPLKGKKGKVLGKSLQKTIQRTIAAMPHGVTKMSADIPELVETSTNVAAIHTTKKGVVLATSQRSSVASEIEEICQTAHAVFVLGGAEAEHNEGYPGWKPNLDSTILKNAKATYKSLTGKEPLVKAIHAGLECGIIGEKYPGMDMVSFGPTLEGVHSPDEKIYIDTVDKFWKFLLAILKNAR
jgi:dipeptidase D